MTADRDDEAMRRQQEGPSIFSAGQGTSPAPARQTGCTPLFPEGGTRPGAAPPDSSKPARTLGAARCNARAAAAAARGAVLNAVWCFFLLGRVFLDATLRDRNAGIPSCLHLEHYEAD